MLQLRLLRHSRFLSSPRILRTRADLARLERSHGNLREAQLQIESSLNIVESLRAQVDSKELRASFLASTRSRYEFYIDLLMRLHDEQPKAGYDRVALHASERELARSLLDLLAESRIDPRQNIDPELRQRESETRLRFSRMQTQLIQASAASSPDRKLITQLEGSLKLLEEESEQIKSEIRRKHPRYAELQYPTPLKLEAIQASLDEIHSAKSKVS